MRDCSEKVRGGEPSIPSRQASARMAGPTNPLGCLFRRSGPEEICTFPRLRISVSPPSDSMFIVKVIQRLMILGRARFTSTSTMTSGG